MQKVSFPVGEGARRFVLFWLLVIGFVVMCLVLSAVAGRYVYHTSQPEGIGYTVYLGGRLIGSH